MTRKVKILLGVFLLSLPFWWGMNLLEKNLNDFLFWYQISQNPQILTADLALMQKLEDLKPFFNKEAENLEINGKSAISLLIKKGDKEKILFEKEINQELPIASLTKLMTADIVLENYDLEKEVEISKEAVSQEEDFGKLKIGKTFQVKYLLYPLLMESSNDAAYALSNDYNEMTEEKFVKLMNLEKEKMNLKNTFFINSTGLDPDEEEPNISTVFDLAKLTKELLEKSLIWEILSTPEYNAFGPELTNTNELLFDESFSWQAEIIGGKTGYTEKAGQCFLLVLEAPKNKGILINVILGTQDKFEEMKKLTDWLNNAYTW